MPTLANDSDSFERLAELANELQAKAKKEPLTPEIVESLANITQRVAAQGALLQSGIGELKSRIEHALGNIAGNANAAHHTAATALTEVRALKTRVEELEKR